MNSGSDIRVALTAGTRPEAEVFSALYQPTPTPRSKLSPVSMAIPRWLPLPPNGSEYDGAPQDFELFNEWLSPRVSYGSCAGSTFGGTGSGVMPVPNFIYQVLVQGKRARKLRLGGSFRYGGSTWGADQVTPEDQEKVDVPARPRTQLELPWSNTIGAILESMFHHAFLLATTPCQPQKYWRRTAARAYHTRSTSLPAM